MTVHHRYISGEYLVHSMYLHALVADDLLMARVDFMQCSVEHFVATVMQGTFDKFSQQLVLALLFFQSSDALFIAK